jgi:DNA polymerase III epsilon subunit-like protein
MSWFVLDCESDGPVPPIHSLVCFGIVKVDEKLETTFYGQTKPISDLWVPEALAVSGFTREQHLAFNDPAEVFIQLNAWINLNSVGRPVILSDNIAYDWQWLNYYFHRYLGQNPCGFSGRRIGDLYCGMQKDSFAGWKHLRKTTHDHNPVNDAKGNAEAILAMQKMGLKIPTK